MPSNSFSLIILFIAHVNLSSTFQWNQNGITVAGLSNGTIGSSSSSLGSCRGIFMDIDDTLYVADADNARTVLIQPNSTTAINIIQDDQNGSSLFISPVDVFVTENHIYVLDSVKVHVLKFLKNGTNPTIIAGITSQTTNSMNTSVLMFPFNLFIDNQEQLYVSDGARSIVIRYPSNSTSGSPGIIIAGGVVMGNDASLLSWPQGIFVDDSGNLYVADSNNHRIQKWLREASAGTTVAGTGISGNSLSRLNYPVAVVVDPYGIMYIADSNNNRIVRWSPNSLSGECIVACTGSAGVTANTLHRPTSITFDRFGNLFVSDRNNYRVQKFSILNSSTQTTTSLFTTTVTTSTTNVTSILTSTTGTTFASMTTTTTTTTSTTSTMLLLTTTGRASNSATFTDFSIHLTTYSMTIALHYLIGIDLSHLELILDI